MSVPKIENTYYSHCGRKSKCKVQAPLRNSWSDLGQKAISSQHFCQTSAKQSVRRFYHEWVVSFSEFLRDGK